MSLSDFKDRKQIKKDELYYIINTLKIDYKLNIGLYLPNETKDTKIVLRIKNYIFLYENISKLWEDLQEVVIVTAVREEDLQHKQYLFRNEINECLEYVENKYGNYEISVKVKNGN